MNQPTTSAPARPFRTEKLFMPGGQLWTAVPRMDLPRHSEAALIGLIQSAGKWTTTAETDATLALRARLPLRTFQRALKDLEGQGVISRQRSRGRRTITLLFHLASKPPKPTPSGKVHPSAKPSATYPPGSAQPQNAKEKKKENGAESDRPAESRPVSSPMGGAPRRFSCPVDDDPARTADMLGSGRFWAAYVPVKIVPKEGGGG